jgi:hypothetical protein
MGWIEKWKATKNLIVVDALTVSNEYSNLKLAEATV